MDVHVRDTSLLKEWKGVWVGVSDAMGADALHEPPVKTVVLRKTPHTVVRLVVNRTRPTATLRLVVDIDEDRRGILKSIHYALRPVASLDADYHMASVASRTLGRISTTVINSVSGLTTASPWLTSSGHDSQNNENNNHFDSF